MAKAVFPYIGITGFMSSSHVSSLLARFPLRGLPEHRLMVGVLVSSKTRDGRTNKWPGRYPKMDDVKNIFLKDGSAINLVHYNTDDTRPLYLQLVELHEMIGVENFDGFQLNIAWPDIASLEDYYDSFGQEKYIVLQVGGRAMAELDNHPKRIAEHIGHYLPMIDYVLIDPSGGKGQPFSPENGLALLREIERQHPSLQLGIAGGFGPNSMAHLEPIAAAFPNVSIDAEGRLRTPQPEDRLDMDAARDYIASAADIFRKNVPVNR